ncbi:MAG: class I SAM-dependent methyltransferase [Bacteroidota bacterium]|mgnify:CR=1 FL=1
MDPQLRFSETVDNYIRYRPGYPKAILELMAEEMGLEESAVIADIGSGTGKLTQLFLDEDHLVYGVEPNREMRRAAEDLLVEYDNFSSVSGSAEQTTLDNQSVDFVVAGQAYHWFEAAAFRKECLRLLPTEGWAVIVWNDREDEHSEFMKAYEAFLQKYSTDYKEIDLRRIDQKALQVLYAKSPIRHAAFNNQQLFDWEGLKGRYLSCSYALKQDHKDYEEALQRLQQIFEQYAEENQVIMKYKTSVYYGQPHA